MHVFLVEVQNLQDTKNSNQIQDAFESFKLAGP